MHARIRPNKGIGWEVRYNEKKLVQGKAECLHAENFVKDLEYLTKEDKVYHFRRLTSLNERVTMSGVHISVNFSSSEKISDTRMCGLAREYMQKIGFGDQPYLVYRHNDTNHPHMHILTCKVESDGERMKIWKIIKEESLKVTREMEVIHSLVKLGVKRSEQAQQQARAQKVIYGEEDTLQAVGNLLKAVVPTYKCVSLPELNAILQTYNVRAKETRYDPAKHKHRGLVYQILDDKGIRIGCGIKSSALDDKPTITNLEKQFALNAFQRDQYEQQWQRRVTTAIDWALLKRTLDIPGLKQALAKEQITLVLQKDGKGIVQGIFYVDHETRAVFDGAALGTRYTLSAIRERCPEMSEAQKEVLRQEQVVKQREVMRQRFGHGLY